MKNNTIVPSWSGGCIPDESLAPFRRALRMISGRWTIEILYALHDGTKRFGELRKSVPGITQHMLTARLRELEERGLVVRSIFAEIPPRVEYTLTDKARGLRPVFAELLRWATENEVEGVS